MTNWTSAWTRQRARLQHSEDLRALQDEINRQWLAQPSVPDLYYQLRRSRYETSIRAAADRLA